jgi:hypothetical protein
MIRFFIFEMFIFDLTISSAAPMVMSDQIMPDKAHMTTDSVKSKPDID